MWLERQLNQKKQLLEDMKEKLKEANQTTAKEKESLVFWVYSLHFSLFICLIIVKLNHRFYIFKFMFGINLKFSAFLLNRIIL